MKAGAWLGVAVGVVVVSAVAMGQGPVAVPKAPSTPAAPTAMLPWPKSQPTVPDATEYLNFPDLLKFCTAQVSAFNGRDAEIIFIGDSITAGWQWSGKAVWDANFAPRNALDFGVSGDTTQDVLWRMENYPIARLHPKVGVVLIGTNNKDDTPEEIAAGVKAVLAKTQALFPGIRIILVSIMPNQRANEKMMAANAILKTYADEKTIYYLDLVPLMTPVGDNWKGLSPDHLHPDAAGYQLWTDAMLPLLNKLLPTAVAEGR
jgi:lysophospholipase L1-like esterase